MKRLNQWLSSEWTTLGGQGEPPHLTLPGEGQWEAACRAGASTPFHFGDTLDASWANYDGGYTFGPGRKGAYRQRPVPVGFFGLVNRWGLAEMHGQLFEWCGDQWHPDPTGEGCPADGQPWEGVDPALEAMGTAQKDWKLLRGGSWFGGPHYCRAAFRNSYHPGHRRHQHRRSPLLSPPPRLPSWCLSPWALPLRGRLASRALGCLVLPWLLGYGLLGWSFWRRRRLEFFRPADQTDRSQMGITPLAWMALSWVASGSPWVSAVATINRSAGSPWKLCGK